MCDGFNGHCQCSRRVVTVTHTEAGAWVGQVKAVWEDLEVFEHLRGQHLARDVAEAND